MNIRDRVLEVISEQFNLTVDELQENVSFTNDLDADSIQLMELVMSIEDEFGIEIDDEAIAEINTIGDLLEYVDTLENKYFK